MLMSMVPAAYAAGTEGTDVTEANGGASEQAAATTDAAKVGERGFPTLAAALDNAQDGATVTLLADVTEDVTINKTITLDLGGKTLTNTSTGKATISVTCGTVTVKNGTVIGGTSYYNIEVTKNSNANLTLEGVTATAGNTGSSMIDNWGTMTITSGTYSGGLDVVKSEEGSTLNISGGKFTLSYATNGYTGVIFAYGTTTITGGEFIQSLTTTGRWNHPQVVATGVVEGYPAITKITGGTFTNNMSGEGIFRGIGKGTSDNFEVSGGTFNKSVSDDFFKDGYFAMKNAGGTYDAAGPFAARVNSTAGYSTLAEAIAAAKAGDTVTLLTDVEVSEPITVNTAITLDLGGKTLTSTWAMQSNAAGAARYALVNNAKMKLTNGTFNVGQARGVGAYAGLTLSGITVTQTLTGGHACVAFCADGATYVVNKNSVIKGAYSLCIFANNATVNISNSTLEGTGNTLYHNGTNYGLKLTVKNTKITSSGSCGVYISGSTSAQENAANQNGAGGYQKASFTGCTISGAMNGVEVKYTDLTLDGCTVKSTSSAAPSYSQNNNGPAASGFAVVSTDNAMDNTTPKPEGTIIIKGNGSYTGLVGLGALDSVKTNYTGFKDETIQVSGGTFSSEVKHEYCAPGFVPKANSDGTYGVTRPSSGSSSYDPTYSVSTPSKTENGSVTVSPKSASKGDTVTITVKPDSGYVLETLTVTDKNGNELTLKDKGDGKYTFTMPAGKVEVKATFMEDNSVLNFFYDVPNDAYFYEAVKWAVKNGITTGVGDNLFAPGQPCTRAQIVTFLWRAAGSPAPKSTVSFADVPAGSYYAKAVAWAVENGITLGTGDGTFSPNATCTRAQSVTFLWRSEKSPAAGTANPFADVKSTAYYADAVLWAVKEDITKGTTNTTFSPDADCTRAQIVTFLWRCKK